MIHYYITREDIGDEDRRIFIYDVRERGSQRIIASFNTEQEAKNWIADRAKKNPIAFE